MAKKGSWLDHYLLTGAVAFVNALPHRAALRFGSLVGLILWAFSKKKVDRAEARCVKSMGVGVTIARSIVRASYVNMGRSIAEFARMERLKPSLRELVSIENKELLDTALARGKGVLMVSAHIGNWELAGARLAADGYSVSPIYTPQRNRGGVEDMISSRRTDEAGMQMVPSRGMGLRSAFRVMQSGGILIFLQDLDARKHGLPVPFMGLPASTADGVVKMYRRFGAPVVTAISARNADNMTHTIYIEKIISDLNDCAGLPFGENMENSLQMCNEVIAEWVQRWPRQWMWLFDRWGSTLKS